MNQSNPFTLFDLSDAIQAIISEIIDAEIAGDEEQVEALIEELDALHGVRNQKYEAYVHVIKNSEITSKACRAEADAFTKRARALENLAKRLKGNLLYDLQAHGDDVVNAGKFKIARQSGQKSVVVNIEAYDLPEEFQRVTIEVDKSALKEALNRGEEIDGAELEDTEHVRIRVR